MVNFQGKEILIKVWNSLKSQFRKTSLDTEIGIERIQLHKLWRQEIAKYDCFIEQAAVKRSRKVIDVALK